MLSNGKSTSCPSFPSHVSFLICLSFCLPLHSFPSSPFFPELELSLTHLPGPPLMLIDCWNNRMKEQTNFLPKLQRTFTAGNKVQQGGNELLDGFIILTFFAQQVWHLLVSSLLSSLPQDISYHWLFFSIPLVSAFPSILLLSPSCIHDFSSLFVCCHFLHLFVLERLCHICFTLLFQPLVSPLPLFPASLPCFFSISSLLFPCLVWAVLHVPFSLFLPHHFDRSSSLFFFFCVIVTVTHLPFFPPCPPTWTILLCHVTYSSLNTLPNTFPPFFHVLLLVLAKITIHYMSFIVCNLVFPWSLSPMHLNGSHVALPLLISFIFWPAYELV